MFKRKRAALRAAAASVGVAGLLLAGFSAPAAQAYSCSGYHIIPYSDGSWSKALTAPNGTVVATTKNVSDGSCTGGWYEHLLMQNTGYRVEMHIWGPQSTTMWPGPWTNIFQNSSKLQTGAWYCAGAHIYQNGRWVKWQYLGCFYTY